MVIAVGAGLMGLSPFLSWVNVILIGPVSLIDAYRLNGTAPVIPILTVAAAILVATLTLSRSPGGPVVALIVGVAGGGILGLFTVGVVDGIRHADGLASLGIGPFVAGAGAAMMIGGAIGSLSRSRN